MFWKRKIQLVCSHCGAKIQVDSKHFQQLEQRKKDDPSNPPSFECHYCHMGQMSLLNTLVSQ